MRVPRAEQGQARTFDELVLLGMRYGQDEAVARTWARCVLRGREIAAQVKREKILSAERRKARARELRG